MPGDREEEEEEEEEEEVADTVALAEAAFKMICRQMGPSGLHGRRGIAAESWRCFSARRSRFSPSRPPSPFQVNPKSTQVDRLAASKSTQVKSTA